jgi:hypothetical protein
MTENCHYHYLANINLFDIDDFVIIFMSNGNIELVIIQLMSDFEQIYISTCQMFLKVAVKIDVGENGVRWTISTLSVILSGF